MSTTDFWQLPEATRNLPLSQTTAWLLYSGHQLTVWWTIFVAQREYHTHGGFITDGVNSASGPKFTVGIRWINKLALGANGFFWVMHLVHTHALGYDALASTAHEMSSQGSVILMLIIILMMEGPKRGLFFGRASFCWNIEAVAVAKRYHGYVFSWAVIYTFWYHPMEGYFGHLFGFFHVWLIMLQGSLMYTTAHLNRYWRMVCEAWVFIHGMVISMQTLSSDSWPMFTFGFGAIFALTQVPGLPCLQDRHWALRVVPLIVFIIAYVVTYVSVTKWTKPHVVVFIPMAEYMGAMALNFAMWLVLRCLKRGSGSNSVVQQNSAELRTTPKALVEEQEAGNAGGKMVIQANDAGAENDDKYFSASSRLGLSTVVLSPEARSKRTTKFIILTILCFVATIACAVIAQTLEYSGSKIGSLVVYVPMCIFVPLSIFTVRAALPFPLNGAFQSGDRGVDASSVRGIREDKQWTRCCNN